MRDNIVTIKLNAEDKIDWIRIAEKKGITLSDFIRSVVSRYVKHYSKTFNENTYLEMMKKDDDQEIIQSLNLLIEKIKNR